MALPCCRQRWKHGEQDLTRTAELLLLSYIPEDSLEEAHAVMVEMRSLRLPIPLSYQTALIRRLARANSFVHANEIFSFILPSNYKPYLSVGLYLYARQGNITRAEEFFNNLRKQECLAPTDKVMLMHAYAVSGRVETVIDLFSEFFPEEGEEKPTIFHYTDYHLCVCSAGRFRRTKLLVESDDGRMVIHQMLMYTALSWRALPVAVTWIRWLLCWIKCVLPIYSLVASTILLSSNSWPGDVILCPQEAIYQRALREGIVPDRIMITALMNAHVEAGSWPGVVRIFDYLKASGYRKIPLTIEVYNTLLKAYVMIGTPFHTVSILFRKLQLTGARPDAYTYALVIQSACDAGLMNVASDLFAEMEDRVGKWEPLRGIEVYVLTCYYGRPSSLGTQLTGQAVYDDMIARGIQPTSITFSQILQAYGNQGSADSLRIAEAFLRGIVEADPQRQVWATPKSIQSALEELYSP
ncbi:hypothetical protein EDD16DRAFT_1080607 [Pisolithus croceorrhizus]|nr:hypothetical protein EDD16DRAFT_1080607 [Pisolithus croceorrhizus]